MTTSKLLSAAFLSFTISLSSMAQSTTTPAAQPAGNTTIQQPSRPWQQYLNDLSLTEDFEGTDWQQYEDLLSEMAHNPINLNTASREDLELLPFLNARQIEDIQAYLYQYGPMKSAGELQLISSLDYEQIALLNYFTFIGEVREKSFPSMKDITRYGKHELMATANIPFYSTAGDHRGYLGPKYRHWARYQFRYGQFLRLGVLGAQDAGEPFLRRGNSYGYDYYSYYLQIKNLGRLKNLTLGRYRLRFGMGLILNNDFSLGKLASLTSLGRSTNAIRPHGSRYAGNYLQGGAATIALTHDLSLTAFISWRNIDATLGKDSASISTIIKSGYHRTATEMNKKSAASEFLTGGNINFFRNGFHAGITGLYTSFDKPLQSKEALYRRYYARGKSFWNISADYGYTGARLTFSGETATGDSKAIATINALSYQVTQKLSLTAIQRFFSYKFYSIYGRSFSEGSTVQNETGFYLGANYNASAYLKLMAYADYAHFPWAKYGVSKASDAFDALLSAQWHKGGWNVSGRYRYHLRQKDDKSHPMENEDEAEGNEESRVGATTYQLMDDVTHRARLSIGYSSTEWHATVQGDFADSDYKANTIGWMVSAMAGWQNSWLRVQGSTALFHTDDYYSRIYIYEPGMLYNMNFLSFYGHGIRYAFSARATIARNLTLATKIGLTEYFNRKPIGTALQTIDASHKTDLEVQARWKF